LKFLKRFLDEAANDCNQRICERLVQLLNALIPTAPVPVDSQALANRVTGIFQQMVHIGGAAGVLSPD
jgi:hypothetical protein